MLTIAEEILLLVLDDDTGKLSVKLPIHSLHYGVSGALLMDLALTGHIDTDLQRLTVINPTPPGDSILDGVLARINEQEEEQPTKYWVDQLAADYDKFGEQILQRLTDRGILTRRDDRFLWVIGVRRYPIVDDAPLRDVKRRIMDVLLTDEIPVPRDIAIICLADACSLWHGLIHRRELTKLQPRIDTVVRLDLIGQSVDRTIRELHGAIRAAEVGWIV